MENLGGNASKEVRAEESIVCKSLGELLKENRLRCKMIQEFVAESLGVSRQAVSKWESNTPDPSTSLLDCSHRRSPHITRVSIIS